MSQLPPASFAGQSGPTAVFYCMRNVYIYPDGESGSGIAGHLCVASQARELGDAVRYLAWTPDFKIAEAAAAAGGTQPSPAQIADLFQLRVPLGDLTALRKQTSRAGIVSLVVTVQGGVAFPPFYFLEGGVDQLLAVLQQLLSIYRSTMTPDLYHLNCSATAPRQATQRQASQRQGGQTLQAQPAKSQRQHQQHQYGTPAPNPDIRAAVRDASWGFFEGMQRVTKLAKDATSNLWQVPPGGVQQAGSQQAGSMAAGVPEDTILGSFEVLDDLPEASKLEQVQQTVQQRALAAPLSTREWIGLFDREGRLQNVASVRQRIYEGGVEEGVRSAAWKYLLAYHPWDSTEAQRARIGQRKEVEYRIYQSQWQTITEEQERHHGKFRSLKERIEKDVVRTDRTWAFFEAEDSPHLQQLHRILLTYAFFNWDIGYVQGMNDLVSVLLIVMHGNEVEAFWCFKGLMDRIMDNFKKDQIGIHSQLTQLAMIVQYLDPELHAHLVATRSTNMFFCFRWILILFKREFPLPDVQRIWEIIWSDHLCGHHHLFVCLSMLRMSRTAILDERLEFDEMLRSQHMNEQSMQLDATAVLEGADALYRQFVLLCDEQKRKEILAMKAQPDMGKR